MTSENENKLGIPFKEFLDKSTNLLTIFGIFNALTLFATSIKDLEISTFLGLIFLVLSLFVLWELIMFAIASSDNSKRYEIFIMLLALSELGLIYYIAISYSGFLIILGYFLLIFLYVFIFDNIFKKSGAKLFMWFTRNYSKEKTKKGINIYLLIYFLIIILISSVLTKYTVRFTLPFFASKISVK